MHHDDLKCPHCGEEITILRCDECTRTFPESDDGAETCEECGGQFCEEHLAPGDHDCTDADGDPDAEDDEDEEKPKPKKRGRPKKK